jgi:hypothetical protein
MNTQAAIALLAAAQGPAVEWKLEDSFLGERVTAFYESMSMTSITTMTESHLKTHYDVSSLATRTLRQSFVRFVEDKVKPTKRQVGSLRFVMNGEGKSNLLIDDLGVIEVRRADSVLQGQLPIRELRVFMTSLFPTPDYQGLGVIDWGPDNPIAIQPDAYVVTT